MGKAVRTIALGLRSRLCSIFVRVRNDTKELLGSVSEFRNAQDKERKPMNVWAGAFLVAVAILAGCLAFPMFAGMADIVFPEAEPDTAAVVSHEAITGLILVSTALGALMVWFAADANRPGRSFVRFIGKLFLCAALAFSLFLLLSPLLPDISSSTDSYSRFLRYVTAISFIGGTASFAVADLFGLVYVWRL